MSFTPQPSLEFFDDNSGRQMLYVYLDAPQWSGWLFFKHPDGHWVSMRKATEQDVAAINKAVVGGHHR